MSKLDLLLKDFYQGESLSQQQLDAIKQSANSSVDNESIKPIDAAISKPHQQFNRINWLQQGIIAMTFVLTLASVATYYLSTQHQKRLVINEIALNHQKPFKADVIESNFITVGNALNGANFDITIPAHIQNQYKLLGARYCSIANQLAIHLQLVDKYTAKTSSLFITPSAKTFRHIENDTELTKQQKAHYWSHKSLFYALLSEEKL